MGALVDLDGLDQRRVWRGRQAQPRALGLQPTGHADLDARLPEGGWPPAALSELLLASPGCGELHLLWPTLARLSGEGGAAVHSLCPGLAGRRGRPALAGAGRGQTGRSALGCRAMPAFGQLCGGAVLAGAGRRSRLASLAGGCRNR